jgi:hypothetical protein
VNKRKKALPIYISILVGSCFIIAAYDGKFIVQSAQTALIVAQYDGYSVCQLRKNPL